MASKYDEAFAELKQIRDDMADLSHESTQTQLDVIARDVRVLAFHVKRLIEREIEHA